MMDHRTVEVIDDSSDEGFIQLQASRDELVIVFVKRPSPQLYPSDEMFCSKMLPAAMKSFMEKHHFMEPKKISVFIDAHPYVAACKCYVRLFISMGMHVVNSLAVRDESVDAFCLTWRIVLAGKPEEGERGHVPLKVTEMDGERLNEAWHVFTQNLD